jgi:hypothetical protein
VVAGLRGGRLGVGERQAASVAAWMTPLGPLTHQVRSEDSERQAASVEAGSAVWAEEDPRTSPPRPRPLERRRSPLRGIRAASLNSRIEVGGYRCPGPRDRTTDCLKVSLVFLLELVVRLSVQCLNT